MLAAPADSLAWAFLRAQLSSINVAGESEAGLPKTGAPFETLVQPSAAHSSTKEPMKVHIAGVTGPSMSGAAELQHTTAWPPMGSGSPHVESGWPQWAGAGAGASDPMFPGDIVCLHGLVHAVELNGAFATIQREAKDAGHWWIAFADGSERVAKSENLFVVQSGGWMAPLAIASPLGAASSGFASPTDFAGALGRFGPWPGACDSPPRQASYKDEVASCSALASPCSDARAPSVGDSETTAGSGGKSPDRADDSSDFASDASDASPGTAAWTTVMMRNLPNDLSGHMLLDLLNEHGFRGLYNLVYLPMDYHRKAGFGYAFIDLVSHEAAERFREHFEGFCDWGMVSHKVCTVSWSDALQGKQAHIDRYRNSPVMHAVVPAGFKPMLFENGVHVPFPPPTKSVRAPRLRRKDARTHERRL